MSITREEWLAAVEEATDVTTKQNSDALTRMEYAALVGVSTATAGRHLKILAEKGKAEKTFKWIRRADGSQVRSAAWRLKKKK